MTDSARIAKRGLALLFLWAFPCATLAANITLRHGLAGMSPRVQQIHQMGLWVCIALGIIVIGAMFYAMFAHRLSGEQASGAFSSSILVEFIWTLIPVLILVAMLIPATSALRDIEIDKNAQSINIGDSERGEQRPPH